jgi:hypothetical protein
MIARSRASIFVIVAKLSALANDERVGSCAFGRSAGVVPRNES